MEPATARYDDVDHFLMEREMPTSKLPAIAAWEDAQITLEQQTAVAALRFRLPGFDSLISDNTEVGETVIGFIATDRLNQPTHLLLILPNGEIFEACSQAIANADAQ